MIVCDLCGKTTACFEKEIEGKEFDLCEQCWAPLAEKLRGKGRTKKRPVEVEEQEEYVESEI